MRTGELKGELARGLAPFSSHPCETHFCAACSFGKVKLVFGKSLFVIQNKMTPPFFYIGLGPPGWSQDIRGRGSEINFHCAVHTLKNWHGESFAR
jgi:hypothetical protein